MTNINTIIEEEKTAQKKEIYTILDKMYADKNYIDCAYEDIVQLTTTAMQRAYEAGQSEERAKDKHLDPEDSSTTRIAISTTCCGGEHQTIAGALLKSKEWKDWYDYASENMLFDVDETLTIDAMSDGHFNSFVEFIRESERAKIRESFDKWNNSTEDIQDWADRVLTPDKTKEITNEDNLK